jgi:hypothetical protein
VQARGLEGDLLSRWLLISFLELHILLGGRKIISKVKYLRLDQVFDFLEWESLMSYKLCGKGKFITRKGSSKFNWVNFESWMKDARKVISAEKWKKRELETNLLGRTRLEVKLLWFQKNQSNVLRTNPTISVPIWSITSNTVWVILQG